MAELVGVISGAITIGALAVNVAMSVAKLKSYWDLLEDAPEDVRRLIEEIEILSLILDDIKDDQTQNPVSNLLLDNASLSKCLENCKKAANRLRRLTDDMGIALIRRTSSRRNGLLRKCYSRRIRLRNLSWNWRVLSDFCLSHTRVIQGVF
jgi:hypothetical protein